MREKPSVTDSPWFWAYLFATGGLIALALMGPKFDYRQSQIERQLSARQRHGYILSPEQGPSEPPAPGRQAIGLRPLFVMLAMLCIGAWIVFWFQQRRQMVKHALPGKLLEQ